MSGFGTLLRKELKESLRTYKLLIVLAVFFILGLATPLVFYFLPSLVPGDEFPLPEFTAAEIAAEYISTIGQIGLIAAILVAMGSVARERESGTAATTLVKPVGAGPFIAAKLTGLALVFIAGVALGSAGAYLYTTVLFEDPGATSFAGAALLAGLYLLICLAVTVMFSSFFKNQLAAGGLALIVMVALTAISALPVMDEYAPGALLTWAGNQAAGQNVSHWGSVIVGTSLVAIAGITGWQVFKTREL
ncbi:MAG: ABC transporter permease [Dehalococcoidia bacterium]|nr:ABC transporter permease [Dehalococcoidia bacterium]